MATPEKPCNTNNFNLLLNTGLHCQTILDFAAPHFSDVTRPASAVALTVSQMSIGPASAVACPIAAWPVQTT
jgi:hypothetical protein